MVVADALEDALGALTLRGEDGAAVELARVYARMLDDGTDRADAVGRQFLAVLESLGMTPRARAAVVSKGGGSAERSPVNVKLDELRQRRRVRERPAAAGDPATP